MRDANVGELAEPGVDSINDRIALNTLAQLFPTREIVPIYSGDFIWGLGAMHCMTQQQPPEEPFSAISSQLSAKREHHR